MILPSRIGRDRTGGRSTFMMMIVHGGIRNLGQIPTQIDRLAVRRMIDASPPRLRRFPLTSIDDGRRATKPAHAV